MSTAPSPAVVQAIESGTTTVTRRMEIYEADGETLWNADSQADPNFARMVSGSVSVDYTRAERRTLDLVLRNDDKQLRPNPNDGFWYDKIIKIYRGVRYAVAEMPPSIAIVENSGTAQAAFQFSSYLNALGFTRTSVLINAQTVSDVTDYDIVIVNTGMAVTTKSALLKALYNSGKAVITIGIGNGTAQLPWATTQGAATGIWGIVPLTTDNPMVGVFTAEDASGGAVAGTAILTVDATAQRVATKTSGGYTNHVTATVAGNASGGRWFDLHLPSAYGVQAGKLLKAGILWSQNYSPIKEWETQIGEFMIDGIKTQNFPFHVTITGRDYTKKLLNSKFENAVTFAKGTNLATLIRSIATNGGISKFKLPAMPENLSSSLSADRGTERWNLIQTAANSFNYELFFDAQGYLVARQFIDPSFGPITMVFKTGPGGNLVSYERSTNDSRLYNHFAVYGDPPEDKTSQLPFFGEAKNTEPSSPTRIGRIGDRLYTYASTFFTSNKQCVDYALSLLKIHALETYELDIGSLVYPWLETGEISEILDPDAFDFDPTRYLIDTLTIDLGLGPMSLTGKRVTFVNDPNTVTVPADEEGAA